MRKPARKNPRYGAAAVPDGRPMLSPLLATCIYLATGSLWLASQGRGSGLAAWPLLWLSCTLIFALLRRSSGISPRTAEPHRHDIASQHRRAEETIWQLTYYDPLTGLPNSFLFRDRMAEAMARARSHDFAVALAMISLHRFKQVNESLGYATGDALLCEVAARLSTAVGAKDTVARLRGDTFCCVLADLAHSTDATPAIERLAQAFDGVFRPNGHELFAAASIGISIYPDDGSEIDDLMRKAETAINRTRHHAPARNYRFYVPEMNVDGRERLWLETELRKAIGQGDLMLYFQPKFATATEQLVGAEALLRWRHPETGLISPTRFIPVAEESGLILPLGDWVLREACLQIRQWRKRGLRPVRIGVNLSGHQFHQPDLVETVLTVLDETGVDPHLIELELTESAVMHKPEVIAARMLELHQAGIRFAIDDFGTGYSSLAHLKSFPLDKLKIDRSFIHDLGTSDASREIVAAIIAMAHSLHLTVVAEGVEKPAQLELLRRLGCDEIQGYYFSQALPAVRFADVLAAGALAKQDAS